MTELARVIVWPVRDPRQRVHLAHDDWQLSGMTLCGEPIKELAPDPHGEPCMRCADALARAS